MDSKIIRDQVQAVVGQKISLQEAEAWTSTYRHNQPNGLRSVYFSSSVFQALINQPNAKGIRIYLANDGSHDTMVLVSANEAADLTDPEYTLYDNGNCSPPFPVTSPLQ